MTYALTTLIFASLALAGAAAVLLHVERALRELRIPLTSDF